MVPRPTQLFALLAFGALLVATPSFAQVSGSAVAARNAGADSARLTSACEPGDRAADDSDDNIVWGTAIQWCGADQASADDSGDNIIWGTAASRDDDNIVWGTVIATPDGGDDAGDSNLSLDDNIVWGT